jgi:hypothetical protein
VIEFTRCRGFGGALSALARIIRVPLSREDEMNRMRLIVATIAFVALTFAVNVAQATPSIPIPPP